MDGVILIGMGILLLAMLMFVFTHSMSLQRFGILEFVTILTVCGCIYVSYRESSVVVEEQYYALYCAQFSGLYPFMAELEGLEDTSSDEALEYYAELDTYMDNYVTGFTDNSDAYLNAVLVQRDEDGAYKECYSIGEDEEFWTNYQSECTQYVEEAMWMGEVLYGDLSDGSTLFAITDKTSDTPDFAVVMEVTGDGLKEKLSSILQNYMLYGLGIIFIATFVHILVIVLQNREIRNMIKLLNRVAEGKDDWRVFTDPQSGVRVRSNEMRSLYTGLRQIATDIMRINYTKYKGLQLYYRFAPKDIDKIMGKNAMSDVMINEQVAVEGTLAYISFHTDVDAKQGDHREDKNACYTALSENRKRNGGIILNSNSDLSTIQLLFQEEISKAVQFGKEAAKEEDTFVLLHRTSFVYGIAGEEEQAYTYVRSKETKVLEKYIDSLKAIGIRMAVTDYVQEMLPNETLYRYVGYIEEGDLRLKLFELLEAYPEDEKQHMIENSAKFNEAMKLFYQSDFYFARRILNEILNDCPKDEVSKYYRAKCEKYLNKAIVEEKRLSLF